MCFICFEKIYAQQTPLDLKSCVKLGLEKNPRIKAMEYEVKKAEADLKAARSDLFPYFSLSISKERVDSIRALGPTDSDYEDQWVDVFDLRISQILFSGLSVINSYKKAKLYKKLVQFQKEQTKSQLILQIVTTFFELMKAKEDVSSYEEAVKNLEVNVKYARALLDKKLITLTDVLNTEVDLANVKTKLSQAKNQVEIYRESLKTLIGINPDKKIEFLTLPVSYLWEFSLSLDDCMKKALNSRYEIKIAHMQLEMAKKDKSIIGGKFLPSVNLNIDYYGTNTYYDEMGIGFFGPYDRDEKNDYWIGQISVYWNLGRGGRYIFEAKKAKYEIARLKKHIQDIKNEVITQVRNYYLSLKEAKQRIAFTKKALYAAKENYKQASKRFKLLIGNISEVLNAQARLTRAEADYNQAILDYNISLARLYYSMGTLNEAMF
jgi:outer membrane protein TolC